MAECISRAKGSAGAKCGGGIGQCNSNEQLGQGQVGVTEGNGGVEYDCVTKHIVWTRCGGVVEHNYGLIMVT